MTRWNPHASGTDTEQFFRDAAAKEGLTYHVWCDKYGIVDNAGSWAVRNHEVQSKSGLDGNPAHKSAGKNYRRGDTPPHYETTDWGPDKSDPTPDNVFETDRRQRGMWRRPR